MPNTYKNLQKAREPQLDEDEKNVAYIRGHTASDIVTRVMKDIYMLKKPIGINLNRRNVVQPFEDPSPIEVLCQKNDCPLFLFTSHNKKRPHNLVMGRLFDGAILDMVEFGIESYKSIEEFSARLSLGVKPVIVFAGEAFETEFDMMRIKNILNDFFQGPRPTKLRIKGIEHIIMFIAHNGKIYMRPYLVEQKKIPGSDKTTAVCHDMGPQLDLAVRRTQLADNEHFTQACKQKPKVAKSTKNKNVSHDELGTTHVVPARFAEKFTVVQAKSGESAKLECNATGDQPLTVNWFKEDNKLSKRGGDNYEIYETTNNNGVNSVLVIRTVSRADGLTYKCLGENEYGNDERLIKLLVIEVPSRPMNVRVKDAWSRSASLVWSTPFAGNSPITSYIIQYWRKNSNEAGQAAQNHRRQEFTVSGTQTSALMTNLMPSLNYEASVIAENQVGRSEPSENIIINTGEDEPTAAPSDVTVEARGPSTVRVAWKSPPSETWNGKLLGFYIGFRPRGAINTIDVNQMTGSTSGAFSYRTIDYVKGQQAFETFLTNLMKGHEYEIVVKAFNNVGSGPESHLMAVRTFDGDLPASPSLFAHQVTHSTISLRWTYPSRAQSSANQIKRYVLYYQRQGDDSWLEIGIPVEEKLRSSNHHSVDGSTGQSSYSMSETGTTNYLLSGLDSGFAYKIYVVAVNNFGMGDPSNIVTTKTEQVNGISDNLRASGSHSAELNVFEMNKQFQLFMVVPVVCTVILVVVIITAVFYCSRRIQNPAAQHVITSQPQQPQNTGTWGPEGPIQVGQRYVEFDKGGILKNNGSIVGTQSSDHAQSGHPGNQGHYPLPYGTMPMNSVVISDQKSWDRQSSAPLKPLVTHIYDSPI